MQKIKLRYYKASGEINYITKKPVKTINERKKVLINLLHPVSNYINMVKVSKRATNIERKEIRVLTPPNLIKRKTYFWLFYKKGLGFKIKYTN